MPHLPLGDFEFSHVDKICYHSDYPLSSLSVSLSLPPLFLSPCLLFASNVLKVHTLVCSLKLDAVSFPSLRNTGVIGISYHQVFEIVHDSSKV